MRIRLPLPVTLRKVTDDKMEWLDTDNHIYNEDLNVSYTLFILGLPVWSFIKNNKYRHTLEDKRDKKVKGFLKDVPK